MKRFRIALIAGLAGALAVAGALLPWVTLFAGLERLPGTTGVYGRALLAGGIVLTTLAVVELRRPTELVRWATGLLGGLLLLPAGLALLGQREIASVDPMLVATAGPGPWVAAGGAAIALIALFLPRQPSRSTPVEADQSTPTPETVRTADR